MEVRPLPLVDKLLQGMLQVLEDRRVGACIWLWFMVIRAWSSCATADVAQEITKAKRKSKRCLIISVDYVPVRNGGKQGHCYKICSNSSMMSAATSVFGFFGYSCLKSREMTVI